MTHNEVTFLRPKKEGRGIDDNTVLTDNIMHELLNGVPYQKERGGVETRIYRNVDKYLNKVRKPREFKTGDRALNVAEASRITSLMLEELRESGGVKTLPSDKNDILYTSKYIAEGYRGRNKNHKKV
jgi:hypothetical protein